MQFCPSWNLVRTFFLAYLVLVEFILNMLQMLKNRKDKSGHVHAGFIVDFLYANLIFWVD